MISENKIYDEFIDANLPAIDWAYVSRHRVLSERQLVKYQRYIDWRIAVQTLSNKQSSVEASHSQRPSDVNVAPKNQPHSRIANTLKFL
jgi:hypothetical protein